MDQEILAATHNGVVHADDAFAAAVLLGAVENLRIVRTRDREELEKCQILFDVGDVYDPEQGKFDHHQKGGAGTRENGIPYSSFGLVWKQYGVKFILRHLAFCVNPPYFPKSENERACLTLYLLEDTDKNLVAPVDAHDNGYPLYDEIGQGETVRPFTVSNLISVLNPTWENQSLELFDQMFIEDIVPVAEMVLRAQINSALARWKARSLVRQAFRTREHPRILVFDRLGVPWQEELYTIDQDNEILFVVFQAISGTWMVQTVPVRSRTFTMRFPLPDEWAGKRKEEIREISGVPDAVFCHKERFLAGAESLEGAIAMAKKALPGGDK